MNMRESIISFPEQFAFSPEIRYGEFLTRERKTIVIAGMGGSRLAADLCAMCYPRMRIIVHADYGLPHLPDDAWKDSLVIASSYSGNTEEALDAFAEAGKRGLPRAALTAGGKLLDAAHKRNIPYVRLPSGFQPRIAIGYAFKGLLALLGENQGLYDASLLVQSLDSSESEKRGRALAEKLVGKVPLVYASSANKPIAYQWKTAFNETAKVPSFINVFPELNHNEMTGFDTGEAMREAAAHYAFILLKDASDDARVAKRMDVFGELMTSRSFSVHEVLLEGEHQFKKIFQSLLYAHWAAFTLAERYGVDPEAVPMVEDFKKRIAS